MAIRLPGPGHHAVKPVAGCDPAGAMLMAGARIGEILVPQCQQRLVRRSVDLERYQGWRRFGEGAVPDPGADEAPGRRHIEKPAADRKALAAADPAHFDAVGSAGA